jgi:CBS domain containing-hemolysin-like protein
LAALGEVRLQAIADGDTGFAPAAQRALRDLEAIRARLLAGRVLCLTTATALAAYVVHEVDGVWAAILAAACVAFVFGVLAEIGTTVARRRAGPWALGMMRWMRPLELVLFPVALPLSWLGTFLEAKVPEASVANPERVTELGLEAVIQEGREEGAIGPEHAELLRSVLEFKNTVAHEVMVPRTQMVAIEVSTPLAEVVKLVVDEGHSRYPVYRDKVDQVVGVLNAKDLFKLVGNGAIADATVADIVRKPVYFATETQKIGTLLREMQSRRVHLTVVVDEFGGTAGIVTLEDILEEIVGDIRDEHDTDDEVPVQEVEPGRYLVDAGISIYDLEERLGVKLQSEEGDYDSLGGMMVDLAGHVPAVGESVSSGDLLLTVRDADQRRVRRVEIKRSGDTVAAE